MEFEWDEDKNQANVLKHGINFREAITIFNGRVVEYTSTKRDYGEVRTLAIGELDGKIIVVIYTIRHGIYRIISSRRASRDERRAYSEI